MKASVSLVSLIVFTPCRCNPVQSVLNLMVFRKQNGARKRPYVLLSLKSTQNRKPVQVGHTSNNSSVSIGSSPHQHRYCQLDDNCRVISFDSSGKVGCRPKFCWK